MLLPITTSKRKELITDNLYLKTNIIGKQRSNDLYNLKTPLFYKQCHHKTDQTPT